MKPEISVVMPVFNGEKWITETLKNLAEQTFKNFEVIIINDGSTDNTQNLAEEFCKKDQRFKLYNKPNGGVSSARNMGIKKARGRYTIHHDVDDKRPKDSLESLYNCALSTQSDIVFGDFVKCYASKEERIEQTFNGNAEDFIRGLLDYKYYGSLCNKLIKTKAFRGIYFEDGLDYREDLLFLIKVLLRGPSIIYLSKTVYFYKIHQNSFTHSKTSNHPKRIKKFIDLIRIEFSDKNVDFDIDRYKLMYKSHAILSNEKIDHKKIYKEVNNHIFKVNAPNINLRIKILLYFESKGIRLFSKIYLLLINIKKTIFK